MRSLFKTVLALAAATVLAATLAAAPAAAKKAAKKPACWKVLINDWYDGKIHGKYGLSCYREALEHLKGSTDVRSYTSAYDDINLAYQLRRAELLGTGSDDGGPPTSSGGGGPGKGGGNDYRSEGFINPDTVPPGRETSQSPAQDLIDRLGPADATSIPIPLIVLAGVALLLMAAGAISLIARRAQGRRVTVPVQPDPPARSN